MQKVLDICFRVALAAFVLGGIVLVATQLVGVVFGNGALVISVAERLGPPTYILASLAGVIAFVLAYLNKWDTSEK